MDNSNKVKARERFKSNGLSYDDITAGDICVLVMLLNKYIKAAVKRKEMSTSTMHMSEKLEMKRNTNGTIKECYLYINSHYFTQREAISFHINGFIGFCGWADEKNETPIIEAFNEWVDYLAETRPAA